MSGARGARESEDKETMMRLEGHRRGAVPSPLGRVLGVLALAAVSLGALAGAASSGVARTALETDSVPTAAVAAISSSPDALPALAPALLAAPECPAGHLPVLRNSVRPAAGERGASSPEAALRLARPDLGGVSQHPWFGGASGGPVWMVASTETFLATRHPDGGWFVSPSAFVGCKSLPSAVRGR